jgi:hypothetical protein
VDFDGSVKLTHPTPKHFKIIKGVKKMATIDFKIQYLSKKGEMPFKPIVNLYLSTYGTDKDGKILLSYELMSEMEIDNYIDGLINDLEKIRRKAKKSWRDKDKQTDEIVKTRNESRESN